MKKKFDILDLAAITIVALTCLIPFYPKQSVHAQSGLASNSYAVSPTFLLANCPGGAISNYTNFCSTGDGKIYECPSTATTCGSSTTSWTCIAGPGCAAAAGVTSVTINGVTKSGTNPSFTLSGSTTQPSISATATTPSTTIAAQ